MDLPVGTIRHIKQYENINGKEVENMDVIEENKNGVLRVRIKKLAKVRCVPFRRNHLLFTNKHRGYFNKNGTLRKKPIHKKTQKKGRK